MSSQSMSSGYCWVNEYESLETISPEERSLIKGHDKDILHQNCYLGKPPGPALCLRSLLHLWAMIWNEHFDTFFLLGIATLNYTLRCNDGSFS